MLQCAQLGHKRFPDSAAIALIYAISREWELGARAGLLSIGPYCHEIGSVPGITRFIAGNLKQGLDNIHYQVKWDKNYKSDWRMYVGGNNTAEVCGNLALLVDYWISRIDPQYSKVWTPEMVREAQEFLSPEEAKLAQYLWLFFREINKVNDYEYYNAHLRADKNNWKKYKALKHDLIAWNMINQPVLRNFRKKYESRYEKIRRTEFEANLKKFRKMLFSDKFNLDRTWNFIYVLDSKYLEKYKKFPFCDEFSKSCKDPGQIKIFNAVFNAKMKRYDKAVAILEKMKNKDTVQEILMIKARLYVRMHKYKKGIAVLDMMKNKDSDLKILMLKAYALQWDGEHSEKSLRQAIKLYNRVLSIDPGNKAAEGHKNSAQYGLKQFQTYTWFKFPWDIFPWGIGLIVFILLVYILLKSMYLI